MSSASVKQKVKKVQNPKKKATEGSKEPSLDLQAAKSFGNGNRSSRIPPVSAKKLDGVKTNSSLKTIRMSSDQEAGGLNISVTRASVNSPSKDAEMLADDDILMLSPANVKPMRKSLGAQFATYAGILFSGLWIGYSALYLYEQINVTTWLAFL